MNTGVYKIRNIINNDYYIGSCSHIKGFPSRWSNHRRLLRANKHHSIILQRAWNKYGEHEFIFEILEECEPQRCVSREQYYFNTLNPKYNILQVAGSSFGRKLTSEQIQKLKDRFYDWMKGDNNWNKSPEKREFYRNRIKIINPRLYFTEESRRKIGDFHRNKPKSEIQKKRMSDAQLGTPKSNSHKENMSKHMKKWAEDNMMGDKNYFYGKRFTGNTNPNFSGYFRFKNKVTNDEIICSQSEFAKRFNFDSGRVSAICSGKRKTHKKWFCVGKEESYGKKI